MTQEDKELLLRDLCARLPYGVKVQDELGRINKLTIGNADLVRLFYNDFSIYGENALSLPLLRPLSSMTEEERHELIHFGGVVRIDTGEVIDVSCLGFKHHANNQDWLNAHHFDYRGLIEKGLALEVPNGMYKI